VTGIGLVMTEIVEFLSAGNFVIMLVLTGLICLLFGTGLPTTASYVVVATLMAPVVVELAAQNDVAVPLIAVHMFVFYFGLMADVSPPVGLAAYAAGAIAGADPLQVGWQGDALREPNGPAAVRLRVQSRNLDDRHRRRRAFFTGGRLRRIGDGHLCGGEPKLAANAQPLVGDAGLAPHLLHAIPTGFLARSTAGAIRGASRRSTGVMLAETVPLGSTLRMRVESQSRSGDDVEKLVRLSMRSGESGAERLARAGLRVGARGQDTVVESVRFGSEAAKYGLSAGDRVRSVLVPADRPSRYWFTIPALGLRAVIVLLQRRRQTSQPAPAAG
jgi:hypothetical protein